MTSSALTIGYKHGIEQPDPTEIRQRLIHAATDLFLAHGFPETSIRQITKRAGVSQSIFISSKVALGHDVADALCGQATARIYRFHPRDVDELVAMLVTWTQMAMARPGWVRLELALSAHGDDGGHRAGQRSGQLRNAVVALLANVCGNTAVGTNGEEIRAVTDVRAMLVWSTIIGFACRNAHHLGVSRDAIEDHIGYVVRFAVT